MNLPELVVFLTATALLGALIALLLRFVAHGTNGILTTAVCGALIGPAAIAAITTSWVKLTHRGHNREL
jgi:hypothetical protein